MTPGRPASPLRSLRSPYAHWREVFGASKINSLGLPTPLKAAFEYPRNLGWLTHGANPYLRSTAPMAVAKPVTAVLGHPRGSQGCSNFVLALHPQNLVEARSMPSSNGGRKRG